MENFKNYFNSLCEKYQVIGANIIVADEKSILQANSYGYSDKENQELINNDTILRIASISKIIIALGIMKLVEQKKLNLNDDISKYLGFTVRNPKYPNVPITIKMVTTQTSSITDGYSDELDEIPLVGYNGVNGMNVDCYLKDLLFNKNSQYYTDLTFGDYKPGTKYNYSNFGCGILACVIEKVTDTYYVDYIYNLLFKPLDIDGSFKIGYIQNKDRIGAIYSPTGRKRDKNVFLNSQIKLYPLGENYRGPAGGCYISNNDLSKIMRMLINKGTFNNIKLFEEETIELMYQQVWFGDSDDEYRAKSVQMRVYEKLGFPILRGHTGGAYGVHSFMFFNIKHKLGICFISNGSHDSQYWRNIEKFYFELQSYVHSKLTKQAKTEIIINRKDNIIILPERKIILDGQLFTKDNKLFIPLNNLSDALEFVPTVKESITIDNYAPVIYFIESTNTISDIAYVPLFDVLDNLNIKYFIHENSNLITIIK